MSLTGAMQTLSCQTLDRSRCVGIGEFELAKLPPRASEVSPSTRLPGMLLHAWMCHRIHGPRCVTRSPASHSPCKHWCVARGMRRWGRQCWRGACGASSGCWVGVHVAGTRRVGVDHTMPDDVSGSEQLRDRSPGLDKVPPGLEKSDTESVAGSDFSGEVEQESGMKHSVLSLLPSEQLSMDWTPVMKNTPHFLRGTFRNC